MISSDYLGFLIRDLDGPASAPEGTITWGHEYSFYRTLDSDALYTSNAGSAFQTEYYDATTNESLETSSVFTQTFAGTPVGMISGVETYHRTYAGGYSIAFLMYGGMQSWNYGGTDSWTWDNPGLSTFDPELLEEVPMRPFGTPQASPHAFAVPSKTKAVWMPPAIIEDPDAPPVEEGEGLSVTGILLSLIPGISYYDAYRSWKAGDYRGMFLNGGFATLDVLSFGSFSKARGLRAFAGGVVKSRVKAEVIDAVAGEAGNVVGDRLGAEAGLLTEMLVSGVLSGKLNSQDQKVLGFAANGGAKKIRPSINLKHIFHGEINKSGKAVGFHHAGSLGHSGRARILEIVTKPGQNGVYRARVSIFDASSGQWIIKKTDSTMFPDSWSRARVLDEIRSAVNNKVLVKGNKIEGVSISGMRIRAYFDVYGNIDTAFPLL